jgi:hypothetical protein
MKALILSTLFIASVSQAHIKPGDHFGTQRDGQKCSMTVGKTYFIDDFKHPLQERIEIKINGEDFLVQHPPVISPSRSLAFFNHDRFHAINANPTGAKAVVIDMGVVDGHKAPTRFVLIDQNYKEKTQSKKVCNLN